MGLVEDIEGAFEPYVRAFVRNDPSVAVLDVSLGPNKISGILTLTEADFAELDGQPPGFDLKAAFDHLCHRRDQTRVPKWNLAHLPAHGVGPGVTGVVGMARGARGSSKPTTAKRKPASRKAKAKASSKSKTTRKPARRRRRRSDG